MTPPLDRPHLHLLPPSDGPATDGRPATPVDPEGDAPPEFVLPPGLTPDAPVGVDPARAWAADLYQQLRAKTTPPTFPSKDEALDALLLLLVTRPAQVPRYAPPAERSLLLRWEQEDGWEYAFRQAEAARALSHILLAPGHKLYTLTQAAERAWKVLEAATAAAQNPQPTKDELTAYKTALNAYTELLDRLTKAEDEARRRQDLPADRAHWQGRYQELVDALGQTYAGHGAHYEILVHQLARHEVRMEQLLASGRDVDPTLLDSSTRTIVSLIGQLQKYTEATKSETITKEVHEAIVLVLEIIERIVAPEAPTLWMRVAYAVQETVAAAAPPPALPPPDPSAVPPDPPDPADDEAVS